MQLCCPEEGMNAGISIHGNNAVIVAEMSHSRLKAEGCRGRLSGTTPAYQKRGALFSGHRSCVGHMKSQDSERPMQELKQWCGFFVTLQILSVSEPEKSATRTCIKVTERP